MKSAPRWVIPFLLLSFSGLLVWLGVHNLQRLFTTKISSNKDVIAYSDGDFLYKFSDWQIAQPVFSGKPSVRFAVTIKNQSPGRILSPQVHHWHLKDNFGNVLGVGPIVFGTASPSMRTDTTHAIDPQSETTDKLGAEILPIAQSVVGEIQIGQKILPIQIDLKGLPGYQPAK